MRCSTCLRRLPVRGTCLPCRHRQAQADKVTRHGRQVARTSRQGAGIMADKL